MRGNLLLLWRRFDIDHALWQIFQIGGFTILFVTLVVFGFMHPEILHEKVGESGGNVVAVFSLLALLGWAAKKAKRLFGNPLSRDLEKYVRNPRYETKVSFIERFQDDFTRILKSYVGKGRVYIFIDDLDRCEVPRAADLMQAINLLLSANQPMPDCTGTFQAPQANLFFLLGIDRELIAAGIAAKNKELLPYVASGRLSSSASNIDLNRVGLSYGYDFLEKFIQVPFRVPELESERVEAWISKLTSIATSTATSNRPNSQANPDGETSVSPLEVDAGADPVDFGDAVAKISAALHFNPRRIKQFINVFRLQVVTLLETGHLIPAESSGDAEPDADGLTVKQIGLLTGILLRWPALLPEISADPKLLSSIASSPWTADGEDTAAASWMKEKRLVDALNLGPDYSLEGADIRVVIDLLPDANKGGLRWGVGTGISVPLVPRGRSNTSSANSRGSVPSRKARARSRRSNPQ